MKWIGWLVLICGPVGRAVPPVVPETFTYKVAESPIRVDVYRSPAQGPRPVIMWLHGGGLIFGNRQAVLPQHVQRYVAAGFTVVAPDYRLAPETKLPEIIRDVEDAYDWLRHHAAALGIDPTRVAVVGHSAGGYLALVTGFAVTPRPRAIVSFYGYGDLTDAWISSPSAFYRTQTIPEAAARAAVIVGGPEVSAPSADDKRLLFYQFARQRGLWQSAVLGDAPQTPARRWSPRFHVDDTFPATLLLHGDADTDVPFEQSVIMRDRLNEYHVENRLIQMEGKNHLFDHSTGDAVVDKAFSEVIGFLHQKLR